MKKALLLCIILLYTVGCSQVKDQVDQQANTNSEVSQRLGDAYYPIIMRDKNVDRNTYYSTLNSTKDFQIVGRDLMRLSTPYFSTDSHFMAEGQYLKSSDFSALLMRTNLEVSNIEYPHSLQPDRGRVIAGIDSPVMVVAIHEQNFYSDNRGQDLVGSSFTIVLDPREADRSQLLSPMSDDEIRAYGEEIIPKFYEYLTTDEVLGEIFGDIPVNICVYQAANRINNTEAGHYILQCYSDESLGAINQLRHRNIVIPSAQAQEIDTRTPTEFSILQSELSNLSIDAVSAIGHGEYKDEVLQFLRIDVTINVKTYGELNFFVSKSRELLDSAFSEMFPIQMIIKTNNNIEAMITKQIGQDAEITMLH